MRNVSAVHSTAPCSRFRWIKCGHSCYDPKMSSVGGAMPLIVQASSGLKNSGTPKCFTLKVRPVPRCGCAELNWSS